MARGVVSPTPPFSTTDRFVDIAAVPGTTTAWAAVERSRRAADRCPARVACEPDGTAEVTTLPASGPGRGSAAKIAFTGPNEGWMVTAAGWVFHYTDGTVYPRDTDPAFAGTITFRPNEAAEQFIPDAPPVDDSELFKPPPVESSRSLPRLPGVCPRCCAGQARAARPHAGSALHGSRAARVCSSSGGARAAPCPHEGTDDEPRAPARCCELESPRWPRRLRFRVPDRGEGGPDTPAHGGDTVPTGGDGDT